MSGKRKPQPAAQPAAEQDKPVESVRTHDEARDVRAGGHVLRNGRWVVVDK